MYLQFSHLQRHPKTKKKKKQKYEKWSKRRKPEREAVVRDQWWDEAGR